MRKLLAVIVVYGRDSLRVPALATLLNANKDGQSTRVVLWDNSPSPSLLTAVSHDGLAELLCVNTPDNRGLSHIYNQVTKKYLQEDEYLLLLDQDSNLPEGFFAALWSAVDRCEDLDLFLPLVRANSRLVSPLSYFYGWGRYWDKAKLGRLSAKSCCAINSGMVIRGRYLREFFPCYDERLRFYGTDTQFMVDYSERRKELCVFDAKLEHDLSFFSADGFSKSMKFLEMKAAHSAIYEKHSFATRLIVGGLMLAVSILYAVRFRSLGYLRNIRG